MKFKVNNKEVFASTGGRPFDKQKPLGIDGIFTRPSASLQSNSAHPS